MADDRVTLGGMALANGVLVHGPTCWACSVRAADGSIRTASGARPRIAPRSLPPVLRGPARLAEAMLLLPLVRRRLPEARFAFERPGVLASMLAATATVRVLRDSKALSPAATELVGGLLALAPATLALRGGELAGYHGAEHVSIGRYEEGPARKEHDRCGSHLVGPLILTSALAASAAARAPERHRRAAATLSSVAAVGVATELFGWMVRNPENAVARALARPGHELQRRFATAEPTPAQLEVAESALEACLALERA